MSNQVNTDLLERTAEMIDYFEGKLPAKELERLLDLQDYEALYYSEKLARAEYNRQQNIKPVLDFTLKDEDEVLETMPF